jgi:large subunit ribosomal protein L29
MPILRKSEIRAMDKETRFKKLSELRAELSKIMAEKAGGGSLENPGRVRALKKTIARILTINREDELST